MAEIGMPLLVHGEVTDPEVDVFDREAVFIDRVLDPLRRRLPELRSCSNTSPPRRRSIMSPPPTPTWRRRSPRIICMINRNALFAGGIRPHLYCSADRQARKAPAGVAPRGDIGRPALFPRHRQRAARAPRPRRPRAAAPASLPHPVALELYAEVFEEEGALDRLEAFASLNGPEFYGLPPNEERVTLRHEPFMVPERIGAGDSAVIPFRAGEILRWRMV